MSFLYRALATGLFVGKIPLAPATFGSLWAVVLAFITGTSGVEYWVTLVSLAVISVVSADTVSKERGERDPREVVIDEVVALYMALATLPMSWKVLALSFVLFRILDVIKPFPARKLEDLPGGWGIVADDVVAGMYTWMAVKLVLHFTNLTI